MGFELTIFIEAFVLSGKVNMIDRLCKVEMPGK